MVKEFCKEIMNRVVATGTVTQENAEKACEVMRKEVKAFLFGNKYENHRECVQYGTINDNYIIASIVAECVNQITN